MPDPPPGPMVEPPGERVPQLPPEPEPEEPVVIEPNPEPPPEHPTYWEIVDVGGPARWDHGLAYDSEQSRPLLFGGDTWGWDGFDWVEIATASQPAADGSFGMTSAGTSVVLHGGNTGGRTNACGSAGLSEATWTFESGEWSLVSCDGPARAGLTLAHDSRRSKTVLFGGESLQGEVSDTWEWDGSGWQQVATDGPSPRRDYAMTYDADAGRVLLFGGRSGGVELQDAWQWDGAEWTLISTDGPPASEAPILLFHPERARVALLTDEETWEWDGAAWELLDLRGPPPRNHAAATYDPGRGHVLLSGGDIDPRPGQRAASDETWIYDTF